MDKFYNRTVQLINDYDPDVIYFDDTYLPMWPVSDVGLKVVAHAYNHSAAKHAGKPEIVITGKVLIRYGTMEQVLEKGDTVYYNSVVPHFVGAVGGPAEILAVLYVPN